MRVAHCKWQVLGTSNLALESGVSAHTLRGLPGRLLHLEYVYLSDNDLIGTIPRELLQRPLLVPLDVFGNPLEGIAHIPRAPFSTDPEENGNAAHHSVAYFQRPLGRERKRLPETEGNSGRWWVAARPHGASRVEISANKRMRPRQPIGLRLPRRVPFFANEGGAWVGIRRLFVLLKHGNFNTGRALPNRPTGSAYRPATHFLQHHRGH